MAGPSSRRPRARGRRHRDHRRVAPCRRSTPSSSTAARSSAWPRLLDRGGELGAELRAAGHPLPSRARRPGPRLRLRQLRACSRPLAPAAGDAGAAQHVGRRPRARATRRTRCPCGRRSPWRPRRTPPRARRGRPCCPCVASSPWRFIRSWIIWSRSTGPAVPIDALDGGEALLDGIGGALPAPLGPVRVERLEVATDGSALSPTFGERVLVLVGHGALLGGWAHRSPSTLLVP